MKIKNKLFIFWLSIAYCLLPTANCFGQDIHFSQFTQTPLHINPAQAGTTAWIRGIAIYRTQWSSVPVPFNTIGASFDIKVKKRWKQVSPKTRTLLFRPNSEKGLGWGVAVNNDRAGDGRMGTLNANLSGAYQVQITRGSMLAAGLQAGVIQRSINYSQLTWENQYSSSQSGFVPGADPKENFSNDKRIMPDLSCGLFYAYRKNERYMRGNDQRDIVLGAALMHVNRPAYSFIGMDERLNSRLVFHGSSILGIKNTNFSLTPGFLYNKQGANREVLFGSLVRYMLKEDSKYTGYVKGATISLGGYYRNKDAFVAAGAIEFSSYSLGISYDINVSQLKAATYGRGGLEITLRFMNPSPFLFTQASFN